MPLCASCHPSMPRPGLAAVWAVLLAAGFPITGCEQDEDTGAAINDGGAADARSGDSGAVDTGTRDTGIVERDSANVPASDGSTDADSCEQRRQAYLEFLAANQDCEKDEDCAVIGDCGPNADFDSVRVDAAAQARELQLQRCASAWDGPMFLPVCRAGRCDLEERHDTCCGCDDAG